MQLLTLYNPDPETDDFIDYDHFAELWLSLIIPALDTVRKKRIRKRKIITLKDLSMKDINISVKELEWLLENCKYANTLDEIIASCIIGVST